MDVIIGIIVLTCLAIIVWGFKTFDTRKEHDPAKAAYMYIQEALYEGKERKEIIIDLLKKFKLDTTEAEITFTQAINHNFHYFKLFYPTYKQAI